MADKRQPPLPDDGTRRERRKALTPREIQDMELAGGVEGGMEAGSGGPREPSSDESSNDNSKPDGDSAA